MQVNIYGCGGGGINLASQFTRTNPDEKGLPSIRVVALDASDSNVRENGLIREKDIFLVPDTDGSGGYRPENFEVMSKYVPQIMLKFPPGDMNIVIFTGGGGSGSVFGPLMIDAMLAAGIPVVGIQIGCGGNLVHARNNFKTLETLEGIADAHGAIVALSYIPYTRSLESQDASAISTASCILKLFSGQIDDIDSEDVAKWIQHTVHTDMGGRVNRLSIATSKQELDEVDEPISIASIYRDRRVPQEDIVSIYHTVGYGLDADNLDQLHYCLSEKDADTMLVEAEKEFKFHEERKNSTVRKKPAVSLGGKFSF